VWVLFGQPAGGWIWVPDYLKDLPDLLPIPIIAFCLFPKQKNRLHN